MLMQGKNHFNLGGGALYSKDLPKMNSNCDEAFENLADELSSIVILLNNGTLPQKEKINWLIESGVSQSRVLSVYPAEYDSEIMMSWFDKLYLALNSSEKINALPDISNDTLQTSAINVLYEMFERFKEEVIASDKDREWQLRYMAMRQ